jgi:hypothetical protein
MNSLLNYNSNGPGPVGIYAGKNLILELTAGPEADYFAPVICAMADLDPKHAGLRMAESLSAWKKRFNPEKAGKPHIKQYRKKLDV